MLRLFILLSATLISLSSQAKLADGLYANLHTNQGDIIVQLEFEKTPLTVINFVGLAEGKKKSNIQIGKPFYNGLKFHRVIDNFMIQGGDPQGNGTGGPGYKFNDEITDLSHDSAGILSMANSGPDTNGSQFFITHEAQPHLDGKHTVFGRVVKGMGIVNSIKKGDFIRKVFIERIGDKAKNFKTNESAFQKYQKKYLINEEDKLTNFVKSNYPNAEIDPQGYYVQVNQLGNGKSPKSGDLVKIKFSIDLSDGTNIREFGQMPPFAAGIGNKIKIIDENVSNMNAGENKTVIATYNQVYGNNTRDSIIIYTLELLSINQLD